MTVRCWPVTRNHRTVLSYISRCLFLRYLLLELFRQLVVGPLQGTTVRSYLLSPSVSFYDIYY
jgi:hypothetical protein